MLIVKFLLKSMKKGKYLPPDNFFFGGGVYFFKIYSP